MHTRSSRWQARERFLPQAHSGSTSASRRPKVRYSGLALGHEIASVFAGGLSPLIATALLAHYHAAWPVAVLLMTMDMITVITLLFTHETAVRREH